MPRNDFVYLYAQKSLYMYLPFVCPGMTVHLYIQELLHSYYRVTVVTPFFGNKECIYCCFPGVATSRVPEPSPMTVADNIFTR